MEEKEKALLTLAADLQFNAETSINNRYYVDSSVWRHYLELLKKATGMTPEQLEVVRVNVERRWEDESKPF